MDEMITIYTNDVRMTYGRTAKPGVSGLCIDCADTHWLMKLEGRVFARPASAEPPTHLVPGAGRKHPQKAL